MQLPGLTIGIVADDLTGANDTALPFFNRGAAASIILDYHNPPELHPETPLQTGVWSINSGSRHMDVRDAISAVRHCFVALRDRYGVENFYKKIDSTLRGHVAQECLAALDELRWDCAVVVPAFPQQGRRTVGGYHLVHGTPLEQTDVARDPLFPIRQTHLPTLLAESSRPEIVGHIELSTVLHGAGPILQALQALLEAGKKLVVIDACTQVDLDQIALALEKARRNANILPCGSAGLAQSLAQLWIPEKKEAPSSLSANRASTTLPEHPILMVIGTSTKTTRHQIQKFQEAFQGFDVEHPFDVFAVPADILLGQTPTNNFTAAVLERLESKRTVILTTCPYDTSLGDTQAVAEEVGIDIGQVPRLVEKALSQLCLQILTQQPVKLILSGGETATQLCKVLNIQQLDIQAEAEPSIPLLRYHAEGSHPKSGYLVTKSGNFGGPQALIHIVRFLKAHEHRLQDLETN
ncbi:MAG: hypothetical protein K2X01_00865 [Cyanobacteria bacterium]|nr:hypothetical protein [Cyanobacteriota bacterium]